MTNFNQGTGDCDHSSKSSQSPFILNVLTFYKVIRICIIMYSRFQMCVQLQVISNKKYKVASYVGAAKLKYMKSTM